MESQKKWKKNVIEVKERKNYNVFPGNILEVNLESWIT